MPTSRTRRVRFGNFELDIRSGQLLQIEPGAGTNKILLQQQPFQVLRLLLEFDGELATREEIKKRLWPNDTEVDFDHSINVAIGTLRRVLGDSATDPKYIQTIARRGYRLMVPTERIEPIQEVAGDHHRLEPDAEVTGKALDSAGLIGKKVSSYRILEVIGGGGMGMVYKAEDLKLGRRVALKFLPEEVKSDHAALQRFEREAQTASSLNHPNICTIYAIDDYEGCPFLAMELLAGETLQDFLARPTRDDISLSAILEISIQICDGLQAAHEKGIIHRDIKPANIFLVQNRTPKILDFGLAKLVGIDDGEGHKTLVEAASTTANGDAGAPLTRTGLTLGTAGYMSPEQIRKEKLDTRTDLFSFGLVLYEMVTRQRAFSGETSASVTDAVLYQPVVPVRALNPAVPRPLEGVIARALHKDRAQRYQSSSEMRADLEKVSREIQPARRRIRLALAVVAALLVLGASTWAYWRHHNSVTLASGDTIVLADISNQTSDTVFDDALNTALHVDLEQTPYLNVLAIDKVRSTLDLLHLPVDTKLTDLHAREVCLSTNSKAVIASSIADKGNHFQIALQGVNCQTGNIFAREGMEVATRDEVVRSLGETALRLRDDLGEPSASLLKFNRPLDQATSASPEALQLLTTGYRNHLAREYSKAISDYQRAIAVDPNFALAYVALGSAYASTADFSRAGETEKKAYELRARMTEPHRFLLETLYYDLATGEREKSLPIYEAWVGDFPRDVRAHLNFSNCLKSLGQQDRAAAEVREAARLLPSAIFYSNLVDATMLANRFDEAEAVFKAAKTRKMDGPDLHVLRFLLAFLQRDQASMQEQIKWTSEQKQVDGYFVFAESAAQAYFGHFRASRRQIQRAVEIAPPTNSPPTYYNRGAMMREIEVGNLAEAHRLAMTLKEVHDRDAQLDLALGFARIGEVHEAQKLVDALTQQFPLDTLVQNYYLPTIRAAMRMHDQDPAGAIDVLRPAIRYDFAAPPSFSGLYPAYLRGLAYLQLRDGQSAAREFQKLLDHSGLVRASVTGALARLQLGRAQVLMGDRVSARKSYESFLSLWKEADAEIPIYQQAKSEYARIF